ncbi:MAG: hypothetical protein H0T79_15250 [Deltaproteobacteria bacterium]|nr:hypothetical protein [Deltaproteobacteria bacterium]
MELSWRLRPSSSALPDKFVDCNANNEPGTGAVTEIRLDWKVDVDGELVTGSSEWQCGDNHGVTGFDLPTGAALLSISPVCADRDADPATYIAPAPERREAIAGQTISLGAMELVLQVNSCDVQPCICQ